MSYFNLFQRDTLPVLRAVLSDASGVLDLSSSTVYLIYKGKYTTGIQPITGEASIITATGGYVEYAWTTGDTINPGVFYYRWLISGADGSLETFPNNGYLIKSQIIPSF